MPAQGSAAVTSSRQSCTLMLAWDPPPRQQHPCLVLIYWHEVGAAYANHYASLCLSVAVTFTTQRTARHNRHIVSTNCAMPLSKQVDSWGSIPPQADQT